MSTKGGALNPEVGTERGGKTLKFRRNKAEIGFFLRIPAFVPSDGNIRANQKRYWANSKKVVRTKRCRNHRSTSLPRPHSYVAEYPSKIQCSTNHGISQRKKQSDDFRKTRESEIQIWGQAFLGKRILWALYIRKTSKRNCFRLGGQPAAPVTIGELSSIYSAIRRNSSAYLNFTLILPPS